MKRFATVALLALVSTGLATTVGLAASEKFTLDKPHTKIGFRVTHIFSKVPGQFNDFDGVIQFDEKDPTQSTVDVTIQATSIDTENEKRDNHLRSADFFEVEKYPTLTFKSRKVTAAEGGKYKVDGDLTIKGITKPVTLDAEINGVGPFGVGGQGMGKKAGFTATTKINRKDFNILWNKTLDNGGMLLSDDVWITLDVEANMAPPAAAKPAAADQKTSAETKK